VRRPIWLAMVWMNATQFHVAAFHTGEMAFDISKHLLGLSFGHVYTIACSPAALEKMDHFGFVLPRLAIYGCITAISGRNYFGPPPSNRGADLAREGWLLARAAGVPS
jgi:hypothetical protein